MKNSMDLTMSNDHRAIHKNLEMNKAVPIFYNNERRTKRMVQFAMRYLHKYGYRHG